ncbi:MAG: hypothetical protein KJ607_06940 [Bacteroidetes bacterium]|nr:hypothetical protein [Bacteroidota bacterium]
MKTRHFFLLLFVPVFALFGFKSSEGDTDQEDKDYNECVEKVESKWGEPCSGCNVYNNSFRLIVKNTCDEAIDVQIAVQNKNNKWQVYYKYNMAPDDTLTTWACNGKGNWMSWARQAGDLQIEFYNEYQINSIYKD